MATQQATTIFSFAYRPIQPVDAQDLPFSINITVDHSLIYTQYAYQYDGFGAPIYQDCFEISPRTQERLINSLNYARPWVRSITGSLQGASNPGAEYTFCIHASDRFRIYDLEEIINRDFCSARGHYARLAYCLLEDVAQLLLKDGLCLQPDCFTWNEGPAAENYDEYQKQAL